MNNVEMGEYTTGQKFARLRLRYDGIDATIEGVGDDNGAAIEDAHRKLRQLSEAAQEAAEAMDV